MPSALLDAARRPRWRLADHPLSYQFLFAGGIVALSSMISVILLLIQVRHQAVASRVVSSSERTVGRLSAMEREFYRQQTLLRELEQTRDSRLIPAIHESRKQWVENFQTAERL